MNYLRVLEKVNNFMNKSGIRDFCRKECFGDCCGSGKRIQKCNSKIRCEDKLSCSIFVCRQNTQELGSILLPILGLRYEKLVDYLPVKINSIIEKVLKDTINIHMANSYFSSYSLSDVEHIKVPKFIDVSEEEIKMIRKKIADLRKGKKSFVCISYKPSSDDIVEKAVLVRAINSRFASNKAHNQHNLSCSSRTMTLKQARSWKESLNKII